MVRSFMHLFAFLSFFVAFNTISAKEVFELQNVNFELTVTSYKYIAILFYDDSPTGKLLEAEWTRAAQLIDTLPKDTEMAKIRGDDPELEEIIQAYGIEVPGFKISRHGIVSEYRGPFQDPEAIANFIIEDAQPSIKRLNSLKELKGILEGKSDSVVFGIYDENKMGEDDTIEGYSIDPWGQFQAAADSLRGHAVFYVVTSDEVKSSFKVNDGDEPVIYMASNEVSGFIKYSGEILEMHLTDWVLSNSAPGMKELTISNTRGGLYAAQFFSSRKLKFILFLTSELIASTKILHFWSKISEIYKNHAIFSYMIHAGGTDVYEYFDINPERDIPVIAAHQPMTDHKFKSMSRLDIRNITEISEFVHGVIKGSIGRILKSEAVPSPSSNKGPVIKVVGSNLIETVSLPDKDVLLLIYTPWCGSTCRKLLPVYDLLGRAVHGDSRIIIAKIDYTTNDIPSSWAVKSTPLLLWFPSMDKPYESSNAITPRSYWDAGYSLPELVGFVQREGSFDQKTLKIATSEQIGSLMGEEETYRMKYIQQEQQHLRNEGRQIYDNWLVDYMLGEVVFDGKRWHIAAAILCGVVFIGFIVVVLYLVYSSMENKPKATKKKKN